MSNRILRQAEKLLARGQWAEACSLLEDAEKCDSDLRLALRRAAILIETDQAELALSVLETLVEKDPSYIPARLYAGIAALESNQVRRAEGILKSAMVLAPNNEIVSCYWELTQLMLGKVSSAQKLLSSRAMPANTGFLIHLTHWVEKEWVERGRFFTPVEFSFLDVSFPPNKRFSKRAALGAFRKRNYQQFLELVAPVVSSANPPSELLFACAFACEMLNGFRHALSFLDRLEPEDQQADPVLAARGRCLVRLGQYYEALDCFEKVLIVGPEDFGLNYYLGVLCLAHGEEKRSRHFFERAYRDYFVDTFEYQYWQIQQALRCELEAQSVGEPQEEAAKPFPSQTD